MQKQNEITFRFQPRGKNMMFKHKVFEIRKLNSIFLNLLFDFNQE